MGGSSPLQLPVLLPHGLAPVRIVQQPFKHLWKDEEESSWNVVIINFGNYNLADLVIDAAVSRHSSDGLVPVQEFEIPGKALTTNPGTSRVTAGRGTQGSKLVFQAVEATVHKGSRELLLLRFKAKRSTPLGQGREYTFSFEVRMAQPSEQSSRGAPVARLQCDPILLRTKQKQCPKRERYARCPTYYDYMNQVETKFLRGEDVFPVDRELTTHIELLAQMHHRRLTSSSRSVSAPASPASTDGGDMEVPSSPRSKRMREAAMGLAEDDAPHCHVRRRTLSASVPSRPMHGLSRLSRSAGSDLGPFLEAMTLRSRSNSEQPAVDQPAWADPEPAAPEAARIGAVAFFGTEALAPLPPAALPEGTLKPFERQASFASNNGDGELAAFMLEAFGPEHP